jgi:hypothetical protein
MHPCRRAIRHNLPIEKKSRVPIFLIGMRLIIKWGKHEINLQNKNAPLSVRGHPKWSRVIVIPIGTFDKVWSVSRVGDLSIILSHLAIYARGDFCFILSHGDIVGAAYGRRPSL